MKFILQFSVPEIFGSDNPSYKFLNAVASFQMKIDKSDPFIYFRGQIAPLTKLKIQTNR